MTLFVGNKMIKCDENGQPVTGESYILFEIVALMQQPNTENAYAPIVSLKKLDDPKPA
jgi:hypothetical protein